jgi:hypothetical protein
MYVEFDWLDKKISFFGFAKFTMQGIDPHSGKLIVSDKASNTSEDGSGITNTTKCKELQEEISQITRKNI